jgi:hypothetical protein
MKTYLSTQIEMYAAKKISALEGPQVGGGISDIERVKKNVNLEVKDMVQKQSIEWRMFRGSDIRQIGETGVYLIGQLQSKLADAPAKDNPDRGVLGLVVGQRNGNKHDYCAVLRLRAKDNSLVYRPIRGEDGVVAVFDKFSDAQRGVDRGVALMITDYCLERQRELEHGKEKRNEKEGLGLDS